MTTPRAIAFLRRKLHFIAQCTLATEKDRQEMREAWEPTFAAILPDAKLPTLRKIDRALEKEMREYVFDEYIECIREKLAEEFGLSRLTREEVEQARVPSPTPGDVTFMPSGRPRPETRREIDYQGVEHVIVDTSARTMGELAQVYADCAGKPVRVPGVLAERAIPAELQAQMREAYASNPVSVLRRHFDRLHVITVTDGNEIVFKDTAARDAVLGEPARPRNVTPEEIRRAAEAMSVDRFWKLLGTAGKNGEGWAVEALEQKLVRCSRDAILGFQLRLEECLSVSYRNDLWAVAYIVRSGCSDDSFEYFRGWLILQGREYFEAALADPERAADRAEGRDAECQEILYVAQNAFSQRTNKPMPGGLTSRPLHATGNDWTEEELPSMFPRLVERFD